MEFTTNNTAYLGEIQIQAVMEDKDKEKEKPKRLVIFGKKRTICFFILQILFLVAAVYLWCNKPKLKSIFPYKEQTHTETNSQDVYYEYFSTTPLCQESKTDREKGI